MSDGADSTFNIHSLGRLAPDLSLALNLSHTHEILVLFHSDPRPSIVTRSKIEEDPKLRADSYEAVQAKVGDLLAQICMTCSHYLLLSKVKLALTAEAQVEDPPEPEPEAPAAGRYARARVRIIIGR